MLILQSFALLVVGSLVSQALLVNITDKASIRNASSVVAYGLLKYYTGNITNTPSTIGVLPAPLYWWEAGAQWGAMMDYWHFTGDTTYNDVTSQALLSQVGPEYDYMVPAHQKDEGNDDQAFWGFAIMSAAEKDFPQPTIGEYSWVQLTENLWNTQVRRWDTATCGGGLKWQIFPFNNGYDYKNAVSNGAFFQLSARLARFTGNHTYYHWAEKSYNWSTTIGLITPDYFVFDGTDDLKNCTDLSKVVWSYNAAIFMYGAAVLYNYTNGSTLWQERTQGHLSQSAFFFDFYKNASNVMFEPACETVNTCNNDQYSFKGYLSRFMWASTLMAPFTTSAITTLLTGSALAAARACSGGFDGVTCGQHWYWDEAYDGNFGIGQQMSALETIQGLLTRYSIPPLHSDQVHLMVVPTSSQAPLPTPTTPAPPPATSSGSAQPGKGTPQLVWSSTIVTIFSLGLL